MVYTSIDTLTTYTNVYWECAQILEDLHLDIVFTLEIIWSLGMQNNNQLYPALVLNQNIMVLPMFLLNLAGFKIYS